MSFTDPLFLVCLVAVMILYHLLPRVLRPYYLLAVSMAFYASWGIEQMIYIVFAALVGWLFALLIGAAAHNTARGTPVTGGRKHLRRLLLMMGILLLIAASFFPGRPALTNGLICMALLLVGIVWRCIREKSVRAAWSVLKEIDISTLGLLFGLFMVVGGITETGVVDAIASLFTKISGGNLFLIYTILVWASVLFSAFIDNIPYVATMLPVTQGIAAAMGVDPTILYYGLLSGATLGGNLTPVGASANITGIGLLRREGYEVKNRDFFRIGIPFTLAAVIPAYIFFWIFYAP